ncbi:Beta-1,3-galactosyltransferase 7 [Capsicum chinense]|nr:Beta-1,3-galactosyltransferase 7 [Capsicum chinense]
MNMDEILKNIYSDSNPFASDPTVTFTVTTFVAINSIVVVVGGGGGGDVVLSKTVDEPEMEMVVRGLEKHLKLDQREFFVSGLSHSWYENKDVSLGSWFIGLDVEHIDERSLGCGTRPRSLYNNAKEGAETPNFEAREVEVNDLQAAVVQYLQFRGTGKFKTNRMCRMRDKPFSENLAKHIGHSTPWSFKHSEN